MSNELSALIVKSARGSWQREIARDLAAGYEVRNPVSDLRGKAKNYAGHYSTSFSNLCERIRAAGVTLERTLGPKGGLFSATWRVVAN
jgi:hypothetical protein